MSNFKNNEGHDIYRGDSYNKVSFVKVTEKIRNESRFIIQELPNVMKEQHRSIWAILKKPDDFVADFTADIWDFMDKNYASLAIYIDGRYERENHPMWGQDYSQETYVIKDTHFIFGKISDTTASNPITDFDGVIVKVWDAERTKFLASVYASKSGDYNVNGLIDGEYALEVVFTDGRSGFYATNIEIDGADEGETDIDVVELQFN